MKTFTPVSEERLRMWLGPQWPQPMTPIPIMAGQYITRSRLLDQPCVRDPELVGHGRALGGLEAVHAHLDALRVAPHVDRDRDAHRLAHRAPRRDAHELGLAR